MSRNRREGYYIGQCLGRIVRSQVRLLGRRIDADLAWVELTYRLGVLQKVRRPRYIAKGWPAGCPVGP